MRSRSPASSRSHVPAGVFRLFFIRSAHIAHLPSRARPAEWGALPGVVGPSLARCETQKRNKAWLQPRSALFGDNWRLNVVVLALNGVERANALCRPTRWFFLKSSKSIPSRSSIGDSMRGCARKVARLGLTTKQRSSRLPRRASRPFPLDLCRPSKTFSGGKRGLPL